jgi:hypothetical protein
MKKMIYSFCIAIATCFCSLALSAQDTIVIENQTIYNFDNNQWQKSLTYDYSYFDNGKLKYMYISYYDTNSVITVQYRYSYTCDVNGNQIRQLYQTKRNDSTWENNTQSLYEYDAKNNRIREDYFHWKFSIDDWDTAQFWREIYYYNDRNLKTGSVSMTQYTTPEVKADTINKRIIAYDEKDRVLEENSFDYTSGQWVKYSRRSYQYNDAEKSMVLLYYYYASDTINRIEKYTWLYGEPGKDTLYLQQVSYDKGQTWINNYKQVTEYDSKNRLTVLYQFSFASEGWQNTHKTIYFYDDTLKTEVIQQDWQNGQWVNNFRTTYRYKIITSEREYDNVNSTFRIEIFPNPAENIINVVYELKAVSKVGYKIYDESGRLYEEIPGEFQEAGQHSLALDTRTMQSGRYFCEFKINGRICTRNIIIEK